MRSSRAIWMWPVTSGILLLPVAESQAQFLPTPRFEQEHLEQRLSTTAAASRPDPVVHAPALPRARQDQSPSRLAVLADGAKRSPSYARHALWGTGIGAAAGLAVGTYSYHANNSGCHDCMIPDTVIPIAGAVVGATAGFLLGCLVYLGARIAAADEH